MRLPEAPWSVSSYLFLSGPYPCRTQSFRLALSASTFLICSLLQRQVAVALHSLPAVSSPVAPLYLTIGLGPARVAAQVGSRASIYTTVDLDPDPSRTCGCPCGGGIHLGCNKTWIPTAIVCIQHKVTVFCPARTEACSVPSARPRHSTMLSSDWRLCMHRQPCRQRMQGCRLVLGGRQQKARLLQQQHLAPKDAKHSIHAGREAGARTYEHLGQKDWLADADWRGRRQAATEGDFCTSTLRSMAHYPCQSTHMNHTMQGLKTIEIPPLETKRSP